MRKLILSIVGSCLLSTVIIAQDQSETGSPVITNYTAKEYQADPQNWAIAQSKSGLLYFGNNTGLLEFDGNTWRLYELPVKSLISALAIGDNENIYIGTPGELGYFTPDKFGKLAFHSLLTFLPEDKRDFSDVCSICFEEGKVYFNAHKYIFIWDVKTKAFTIIRSDKGFHTMFDVNGTVYVREWGKGLEVLKNNSLTVTKDGERFAKDGIFSLLPFPGKKGTLLVATRTMGLFKYDGNKFTPFKTGADVFLKNNMVYYPGNILSDGNILLATINGGAIVIDSTGKKINLYNADNGLTDAPINYSFQDRAGNIWLATDNGLSKIDYNSPAGYFDARHNFSAFTLDIIRHNGAIYAATNKGVYILDPATLAFKLLKNSNSTCWNFLETGGKLLAATTDGLFIVDKDKLTESEASAHNHNAFYILKQSRSDSNKILAATANGLWSLKKTTTGWVNDKKILDNEDQPISLIENKDGSLWMTTTSSGVFSVKMNDHTGNHFSGTQVVENFDKTNGLQDGFVAAVEVDGVDYFATADSIYKFDDNKKRFYSDTTDKIIAAFYSLQANKPNALFQKDGLDRLWIGTDSKVAMGNGSENYSWISSPFNGIVQNLVNNIYAEKNGIVWFATGSGIIRFNLLKKNTGKTDYSSLVRDVEIGKDSTIFFGDQPAKNYVPQIIFKYNSIKFRYSATSYEHSNSNQFRTLLKGFDKDWSSWSMETSRTYTNLPPGKYTFNVVAKNLFDIESNTATFSFEILPPWYQTWWAYLLYSIVAVASVWGLINYRSQALKKSNKVLEHKVKLRTAEVQEQKEQLAAQRDHLEKTLEDLQSTQAQLIQSEKMASLGELTAGIAHEIQNPLNFVNNFSEVSKELIDELKIKNDELKINDEEVNDLLNDIKQNLDKINHHGRRADAIVKGMLEHSRQNAGIKELKDINATCDEYLRLSYHGLRAKDKGFTADFKTVFDENIGKVNVVPQDIGRVLLNMFNNAFYAVNEKQKTESAKQNAAYKPIVSVQTKKSGTKIEVIIADNGNGIPHKIIDKIFQPFFTTKPTGQGTGLGLSLSYDIIKSHGGEIKVRSEEREGTTFTIELPYA